MNDEELRQLDEFKNLAYANNWNRNKADMSGEGITGIVLTVAFIGFIVFLICLCCPFCLLAKYRRRRGHVYSQAQGTAHTVITSQNGTRNASHVITVNNTPRANAGYPVQPTVTVVPLMNPQTNSQPPPIMGQGYGHGHYPQYGNVPSHQGQSNMPMPMPMPMPDNDLPPPYPGLPRAADSASANNSNFPQPAYNPYFSDSNQPNSTSAPYPSKY